MNSAKPNEEASAGEKSHLLAETESLVAIVDTMVAKLRYMLIAAATIALAVVGFTGAIISTAVFTPEYAAPAFYAVASGAAAGFLGVFALNAHEALLNQARYVKVQFEFGPRPEIEKAKADFERRTKSFWSTWGLPLVALFTSLSGVLAMIAFYEVVYP